MTTVHWQAMGTVLALLLVGCGATVAGQPLGAAATATAPALSKIQCPPGHYRSSAVIWVCNAAAGRRFYYMKPNAVETALKLPVGVRDLRINASSTADADLQLLDPATQTYVIHNGHLIVGNAGRMQIDYTNRGPGVPPVKSLHISEVTSHLILKFHNRDSRWRTVALSFSFQGVTPCPEVPSGCSIYDEAAAWAEVSDWSKWVQSKFKNAGVAWQTLAADLSDHVGGRSAGVPWYRWGAVWDRWGLESSESSWERTFALLDKDGDEHISLPEFAYGFRLAGGPGDQGQGFFIPSWTIWALPLLAVGCLGARFLLREASHRPSYLELQPSAGFSGSSFESGYESAMALPFMLPGRANVSEAGTTKVPADGRSDPRTFRGCENGFQKWGLLECGMRGVGGGNKDKGVPGRPQCSKCGWSCRCPNCSRDNRVLPPVLAWRGPNETTEEDEIQALVKAMKADPQNGSLQETSCARLEELSLGHTSRKKIVSCGGIEAIVEAMQHHAFAPKIQEHACGTLGNLALRSEENQKVIGQQKGVEHIVKAMAEHPQAEKVQERGLWAVEQLAMTSTNRRDIVNCGGIERVVNAMRTHPQSEAAQEHGCMALGNMAFETENRKRVAYAQGIDSIVSAMGSFPGSPALQEDACFALHNMACSDEAMKPISDAGGIEAVLRAMHQHPMVPGVQENGLNALHNVNCGPLSYIHKVAHCDGIRLILEAMHHSVPSLQAKACHLLGQLGDRDDDVRRRIVEAGGIRAVELAKSSFSSSKEVQHEAKEALKILNDNV